MGFSRNFCFFIVTEEIILGNIQAYETISNLVSEGFENSYTTYINSSTLQWAHVPSYIQVLINFILVKGLLERKPKKFIPWLLLNAFESIVSSVSIVVNFFNTSFILAIELGLSNPQARHYLTLLILMIFITVLQWAIWLKVLLYYRHLKIKENERKINADQIEKDENDKNPTVKTVSIDYPKMFDSRFQHCNAELNQGEKQESFYWSWLYAPSAPALDL